VTMCIGGGQGIAAVFERLWLRRQVAAGRSSGWPAGQGPRRRAFRGRSGLSPWPGWGF